MYIVIQPETFMKLNWITLQGGLRNNLKLNRAKSAEFIFNDRKCESQSP